MDNGVFQELDEAKDEIEKLKSEYRIKVELSESLKKSLNEHLRRIEGANSKIEKQMQELNEKAEEVSLAQQMCEDLKCSLVEKESIIKNLSAANNKLRIDSDKKFRKLEDENRELVLAMDKANEKNILHEKKIYAFEQEMFRLKESVSLSQKKCLEAERKTEVSKELREKDDMLLNFEDEKRKVGDQLKWKKEQFEHLEEAHKKLRDDFSTNKQEWKQEKSTLLDEICSLETRLDSQKRMAEDLHRRFEMCNQALAHEESRRKYLEVQVSEHQTNFENVFAECQDAKSKVEYISSKRDKEIAALRNSLGTKEALCKEMEYHAGRLEQENQELLASLKELRETRIREGGASSVAKFRSKLRSLEQTHKDCFANLKAKEAEWSSQLEKVTSELNACNSELKTKNATIQELEMELEASYSSMVQLKLQSEEISLMLLVLKMAISEAQLKFANNKAKILREKESVSLLPQLGIAQTNIKEERDKAASLLAQVEALRLVEGEQLLMQKESEEWYREMLEESSRWKLCLHDAKVENDSVDKLKFANNEANILHDKVSVSVLQKQLDIAQVDIKDERDKVASLLTKIEALRLVEEQQLLMQNKSEQRVSLLQKQLEIAQTNIKEERDKVASLLVQLEAFHLVEEQQLHMQKELERYREMLEESSRCQLHLKQHAERLENDYEEKLRELWDAIDRVNSELDDKICEGSETEFELLTWKSIAERSRVDLDENQQMRKQLEASLLLQVEAEENLKQDKDCLIGELDEKDRQIDALKEHIMVLEKELKQRESEAATISSKMETLMFYELEKENFLNTIKEKDKILEDLQKKIELLEHESLGGKLEGYMLAQISAERKSEQENENLIQIVTERDQKIDDPVHLVRSRKECSNSLPASFSQQLADKQGEINLVLEAWEKIVSAATILTEIEIEVKKLMIAELEDDIHNVQQKFELQDRLLSSSKVEIIKIEAELEAKKLEMEIKLRNSDALVDELKNEKQSLLENLTRLSYEKENLLGLIGEMSGKIGELSNDDMKLIATLGRIVQSFDGKTYGSRMDLEGDDEFSAKENYVNKSSSLMTSKLEINHEERSPFRELNP